MKRKSIFRARAKNIFFLLTGRACVAVSATALAHMAEARTQLLSAKTIAVRRLRVLPVFSVFGRSINSSA
jgi:hypothetical protein